LWNAEALIDDIRLQSPINTTIPCPVYSGLTSIYRLIRETVRIALLPG
jgi:hypothetical protein